MSLLPNRTLLAALVALACVVGSVQRAHAQSDDDDADDDETAQPVPAPAPAPAPTPASPSSPAAQPAQPAAQPAQPADTSSVPAASAPQIQLTGGAPLNDPDVEVHTVQKKVLADKGRHEVVLFPVVAQVNGKFSNHIGVAAEYLYHFQENVAVQLAGSYFYVNQESSFNDDLINIAQVTAQAATALTMQWNAEAGIEAEPIYGKFAFYKGYMASFAIVLDAGLGLAKTRVELAPSSFDSDNNSVPAIFGDTGFRFMGNVGGGFRVRFGEHWVMRLELRDQVYTAAVSSVNGCISDDLHELTGHGTQVNGGCQPDKFPVDANGDRTASWSLANSLVKTPSSDVLNQLLFFGGVAYVF